MKDFGSPETWNMKVDEFLEKKSQASLIEDLAPGPLRDEYLKDYDPKQETYEEYLRRKSIPIETRPFNMAKGGIIQGKNLGTREGFSEVKIDKRTQRPLDFERRNQIKQIIIDEIENFKKSENRLPNEKYDFNKDKIIQIIENKTGRGSDYNTVSEVFDSLDPKIKNDVYVLKLGESSTTGLSEAEKNLFKNNYNKKTISQMAAEITGKPYTNKITKAKGAQIYRYFITLNKKGALEKSDIARGTRPKGTTPSGYGGFKEYTKTQQALMDLDPEYYKDLTPSMLDNKLRKAIQFSKVRGAFDVPTSLVPSFEHFQGLLPSQIVQDPSGLRKVGITTRDYNFNVMGAKAKEGMYKVIKDNLRTAKRALSLGDTKTAKEAIETVNEIYQDVANKLKYVDRKKLPKYTILGDSIKETNIKPIDLGSQKRLSNVIEDYIRFVATGPQKDISKIKQNNLQKAIEFVKKGDYGSLKKLIKSRLPAINANKLFSILPPAVAAPLILNAMSSDLQSAEPGTEGAKETSLMDEVLGPKGAAAGAALLTKPGRAIAGNILRTLAYLDTPLVGGAFTASSISDLKKDIEEGKQTDVSALELTGPAAFSNLTAQELGLYGKKTGIRKAFDTLLRGGMSRVMAERFLPILAKGSTYATPLVELGIQTYNAKQRLEEAKEKYGTDDMVPTAMGMAPKQYVEELASELPDIDRTGAMGGGIMRAMYSNGPKDPSKRKFMQLGLGIASLLPFGIGRLARKPAVKEAVENAPVVAEQGWSWVKDNFWTVVDTIKKKASGFAKLRDGEVTMHKDMEVIENADTIRVRYRTDNENMAETVYNKPYKEVDPNTGEVIDVPGSFEEYQDVYRMGKDDYYKDFEEEIIDSVDNVKKIITED